MAKGGRPWLQYPPDSPTNRREHNVVPASHSFVELPDYLNSQIRPEPSTRYQTTEASSFPSIAYSDLNSGRATVSPVFRDTGSCAPTSCMRASILSASS